MADYHGVLRRTLSGFGDPGPEMRRKVYERARVTILRQLDTTQPPLSDAVKERQIAQLDEAIAEIEASYGDAAVPAEDTAEAPEAVPAPTDDAPEADPLPEPGASEAETVEASDDGRDAADGAVEAASADEDPANPIEDAYRRIEEARHDVESEAAPPVDLDPAGEVAAADDTPRVKSFVDTIQERAGVSTDEPVAEVPVDDIPVDEMPGVDGTPDGPPPVDLSSADLPPDDLPPADLPPPDEAEPVDLPPIPIVPRPDDEQSGEPLAATADDVFSEEAFEQAARASETEGAADADVRVDPLFASDDTAPASGAAPSGGVAGSTVTDPAAAAAELEDASRYFNDPALDAREAEALAAPPVPPVLEPKRKGGRGILLTLVVIALLLLAAVVAWPLRGSILSAMNLPEDTIDAALAPYLPFVDDPNDPTRPRSVRTVPIRPAPEEPETPGETPAPVPVEETKREQRLGADGEELAPAPAREDVNTLPPPATPSPVTPAEPETPAVESTVPIAPTVPAPEGAPASDATGEDDAQTIEPETEGAPDDGATEDVAVTDDAPLSPEASDPDATDPAAAPAADGGALVAQRAALVEEAAGAGGTNASFEGQVVWTLTEEDDASGEPQKVIRGRAEVGAKGMVAIVSIKRNEDASLTASHLIEIVFAVPDGFDGGAIDEIQGMELKPAPQAGGRALVGVPVRIAPGIFFVALNNLPNARDANVAALRGNDIMDIAVRYANGRGAVLRLEKGTPGARVFDEAFAAWAAAGGNGAAGGEPAAAEQPQQ